jgi:phosphomannomutase
MSADRKELRMDRLMVSVSGVRGTVGGALTPGVAAEFGCAFGAVLGAGKTCVLGRDTRTSGPAVRNAVSAGLLASGVNVVDLGVATTPGIALMTKALDADGGVVVTASHNPAAYNGIKFLQPTGTGLTAGDAERLRRVWEGGEFALAGPDGQGVESHNDETHPRHVEAVYGVCDAAAVARKKFTVVLDSVNGAGCVVTPMLLERLGCKVAHVNGEPTGRFAHPPEPVAENLAGLCDAVRQHGAAVGFAQDADADRLAIVDEAGRFIGEEYTLALAAAFVLRHCEGKLATNLATSRMIDDLASAAGCEVVRAPTGEANVVEAMRREGCIFGGEGGGGVIEPRVVEVRDSLVGIAYVLQSLAETGKRLSELVAEIPAYVMRKTKLPCPAGAAERVTAAAREAFEHRAGAKLNDADGLRVDLPAGWVCVRASNTEPILRIIAEAPDEATVDALVEEVRKIAERVVGEGDG